MPAVGQIERKTQQRVVKLFREQLGYAYLGDWTDREGNANSEPERLRGWLARQGVEDALINRALHILEKAAGDTSRSLYDRNRAVYDFLRYGVKVRPDVGENTVTVWLIDWKHPEKNDFAIAEEVTVAGSDAKAHTKRPDVVLYVNGIALGVLELKRSTVSVTPVLLTDPPFDAGRDVLPVAMVATSPFMIAVNSGAGVGTLAELVALAREQPGKINVAVVALFSGTHLTTEMLNVAAGVRLFPVPYNGSPNAVVAAVTGQSQAIVDSIGVVAPQWRAGKLRLLAVTSPQRLANYPDLPAAAETLPGFQMIGWVAVFAPRNTPAAIVEKANRDGNTAIQVPELAAKLVEIGFYPSPGSAAGFAEFLKTERERWGKIARDAGVQPQ